ncbi:hypothetical protein AB1Y20_004470 [Prymnesium parvum]|uniref:Sister chromatid cohesion protein n=1 Tax=Prymnesium parvum TaxID=97485 RepID=A0AB34IWM3_PRYPA
MEGLLQAKGAALVGKLKKLADELAEHEQSEFSDRDFLAACTEALSSQKLLRHRDPDVRLLTACCLADLLRIYAPETPFDDGRLKDVFELFVAQLRGVEDIASPSFSRFAYLLERLAVVQAFVLILELNCDDLICQLFETLFMSISTDHELRSEQYMSDILTTVLEDLDVIPQAVLDTVLENLVEPRRTERRAAHQLARKVVQRCSSVLAKPIQEFLASCLPSSSAARPESELRDDWPHLVCEITSIDIEMVTYLLPQLQDLLVMEEEHIRVQCTELLGKLFAMTEVNVARQFPQLFHGSGFLSKFIDASPAVRVTAIEHGAMLVSTQPALAGDLLAALKERICDPDDKVRATVVKLICSACVERIGVFGALLPELRHRISDKKPTVQRVARAEAASLYRKHVAIHLTGSLTDDVEVPLEIEWVPRALLQIFGADTARRDFESRAEVEQLLQVKLLPAEETKRLHAVCVLHQSLEGPQRTALKVLLRCKRTSQRHIARWLELQRATKEHKADNKLKEELAQVVNVLCADHPDPAAAKEVWEQLGLCKDQNVTRYLLVVATPTSSYDELVKAQDELRRRMSTRLQPAQLQLLQSIAARPAMSGLLWRSAVESILRVVASDVCEEHRSQALLALLLDCVSVVPELVSSTGGAKALADAIDAAHRGGSARSEVFCQLLRVVHAVSPQLEDASAGLRKPIVALLCQVCCAKEEKLGKLAAQCLSTCVLVPAVRQRTLETLLSKLLPLIQGRERPAQHCALAVLGVLAKRTPDALGDEWEPALEDLRELVMTTKPDTADKALVLARCKSQQMAITVLANDILGSFGTAEASPDDEDASGQAVVCERGKALVQLLLAILESGGHTGAASAAKDEQRAQLRLSAARGLLKLARIAPLKADAVLGPLGWHRLALCMQDEEPLVRIGVARKLHAEHMRHFRHDKRTTKLGAPAHFLASRRMGLPPHYLTMLALAAVDPERAHVTEAKAMLTQLVRLWHGTAAQHKKPHLLPELQLPWLLHVLGHHPDFEEDLNEARAGEAHAGFLATTQRCIDFYLSAVLSDGYCEYEMLRNLVGIVKRAVDRVSPNGIEVRVAADVARALLVTRSKDRKWSSNPSPPLSLPALLFFKVDERRLHADVDLLPRNFEILDGLAKSKDAREVKRKTSEAGASPNVKRLKAKTPTSKGLKTLPSPRPSSGGNSSLERHGKRPQGTPQLLGFNSLDADDEEKDDEEEESIPDGAGASEDEGRVDHLSEEVKIQQQREEREARMQKRAYRESTNTANFPERKEDQTNTRRRHSTDSPASTKSPAPKRSAASTERMSPSKVRESGLDENQSLQTSKANLPNSSDISPLRGTKRKLGRLRAKA